MPRRIDDRLPIGQLDRQLVIQKQIQGEGSTYGEATESWVTWATVWGGLLPASGKEMYRARQQQAEIDAGFQIYWMTGLLSTMRISYQGRTYDIYDIQEVGRRDRLNIFAKARRV